VLQRLFKMHDCHRAFACADSLNVRMHIRALRRLDFDAQHRAYREEHPRAVHNPQQAVPELRTTVQSDAVHKAKLGRHCVSQHVPAPAEESHLKVEFIALIAPVDVEVARTNIDAEHRAGRAVQAVAEHRRVN
jgi:hypothetical protein